MSFEQWLQSRLTSHGFPCGLIDGIIGPVTLSALEAFQKHYGLAATGVSDQATVKALRAEPQPASPANMVEIPDRNSDVGEDLNLVPQIWPRQGDVGSYYGGVGTSQVKVPIPWDCVLAWRTSQPIKAMTLHSKVAESAERVMNVVKDRYSDKELHQLGLHLWGGSLNVRKMRGGSRYSMHSWGIAIDWDPARNRLSWHKPKTCLSNAEAAPFWRAWEAEGWLSLGRARDFDWMHVQAARL